MKYVKLLLLALSASIAPSHAQTPSISLNLEGEQGDINVQVGESLQRDVAKGIVRLTGGIQIRQADGAIVLADSAVLISEPNAIFTRDAEALEGATLIGRVYLRNSDGFEIEAETLELRDELTRFEALGAPVVVKIDSQSLEANEGLLGNLDTRTFYGYGGATISLNDGKLVGNEVQITLPKNPQDRPKVLARGDVLFVNLTASVAADQMESSDDGRFLTLSGNVDVTSGSSNFSSGSILIDLETEAFTLEAANTEPQAALNFLKP